MSRYPVVTTPPPPSALRPLVLPRREEFVTADGLRVILVEDRRVPFVTLRLVVRAGSVHDPADLPGLASLTAHCLTQGTQKRKSFQFARAVEELGATLEAHANRDYSTVSATVLAENLNALLSLLAETVMTPAFSPDEVELAKENTVQTLRYQRTQPAFLARERYAQVLFGNHPYARIAPTEESVRAMTPDTLREFHARNYTPDNSLLVVVGAVDRAQLQRALERAFAGWQARGVPHAPHEPPPSRERRTVHIVHRPGSVQVNLLIGHLAPRPNDPDFLPLEVVNTALGGRAGSRLFMNVREQKGFAYDVGSHLSEHREASSFSMSAQVRPEVVGEAVGEMLGEVEVLRREGITQSELESTQNYLNGTFSIRLSTQGGIAGEIVAIEMLELPRDSMETYRERVQAVTLEAIRDVVQRHLFPDRMAVVAVGEAEQIQPLLEPFGEVEVSVAM
ncbi:MAG: insulinase family protein [Armatimonadetes bacterium]|nr:insulinase family protein [Armatimonadota bacterium]